MVDKNIGQFTGIPHVCGGEPELSMPEIAVDVRVFPMYVGVNRNCEDNLRQ